MSGNGSTSTTTPEGTGRIVAGALAPHPPHLVYAENPPQNEPRAECGWEELRWGYERARKVLEAKDYDVIVVHSPHWPTVCGHHFLGVPHFKNISVDPIFPHLFRFNYELDVDVELAEAIHDEAKGAGLITKMMRNPNFRVDYGTIISCHMVNPKWDKPIVGISSNRAYTYFSNEVGDREMITLGQSARRAIEKLGRRALVLSSCSLSHRHFTVEPRIPEDMSQEHIYHHGQYLWDMRMIEHFRKGRTRQAIAEMPDFIDQAIAETRDGSLTFMLAALDFPSYPGEVHAYGSIIGTGNAIVTWDAEAHAPVAASR